MAVSMQRTPPVKDQFCLVLDEAQDQEFYNTGEPLCTSDQTGFSSAVLAGAANMREQSGETTKQHPQNNIPHPKTRTNPVLNFEKGNCIKTKVI